MELNKIKDTMILDSGKKKLEIHVNVNSNLDFSMNLKSDVIDKNSHCFIIDDKNISIYYAISKLYENLLDEYNINSDFYKNRYLEYPIYNEKLNMFKFHNDNDKINPYEFIRLFRRNGMYYVFFNMKSRNFRLSKSQSRYPNFVKYFNKFYSNLEKEYIRQNKFNVKTYKYGDKKNG